VADLDFVVSERAKSFILDLPLFDPPPLEDSFPAHKSEKHAMDLVKKLLIFHPEKRISVDDALLHPFMETLHNAEDEPSANFVVCFDFENEELTKERVQELIWDELKDMHPEIPSYFPSSSVRRRSSSKILGSVSLDSKADSKKNLDDESSTQPVTTFSKKRSISPSSK